MKIAYLFHWNEAQNAGVYKKIVSQIAAWEACGHSVEAYHVTNTTLSLQLAWRTYEYRPAIQGISTRLRAWEKVTEDIFTWAPDVVYYRYGMFCPGQLRLVTSIPLVVEVNTDDVSEYNLASSIRGLYNYLTRGLMLNRVAGMVFVTSELASLPHFQKYNKNHIVIGNGVDLGQFEPLPPTGNLHPRLVFMGSPGQSWHGVDKIIALAQKRPSWKFDLVGLPTQNFFMASLPNVACHGYLHTTDYNEILTRADVAIGTLALHRKGLSEASPLKLREYLAFGLPTIIGYEDTDFPSGAPFLLQLPNCEDNISEYATMIQRFVEQWMGKRVARSEISHLDVRQKESQRLEFMKKVISGV